MFKFRYRTATRVYILESFLGIYIYIYTYYMYFQTEGCTCMNSEMNGTVLKRKREMSCL